MRILYHSDQAWPHIGGVETLLDHLGQGLAARGHQVAVICDRPPGAPAQEIHGGLSLHRLEMCRPLLRQDFAAVIQAARSYHSLREQFAPDLVHCHLCGISAYFAFRSPHPRSLTTIHDPFGMVPNSISLRAVQQSRAVIAISDFVARRCRQNYSGLEPVTIYNAQPNFPESLHEHRLEPAHFLCFGRLAEEKGFDVAIRAFAQLPPGCSLEIVGEGPAAASLQALSRELAVEVGFSGALTRSEVLERLDGCTAVVVPSRWEEPFGMVAIESMARGRPVIAARRGALPELVEEGRTGLLFSSENAAELAQHMQKLRQDPGFCASLGVRAALAVPERFPFSRFLEDHVRLYERLLA